MEDLTYKNKIIVFIETFILMILLQGIMEYFKWLFAPHLPDTRFFRNMITMSVMIALTIILFLYAKIRGQTLAFFPEKFSKKYIIATCIVVAIYIAAPTNFSDGITSVMMILYSSIVTPVFEELLFRGYIWGRFEKVMTSEIHIYIWNIALFTIWRLFYIIPDMLWGNWDPLQLLKITAGLGYGTVLGFIRIKTKNFWATILAHGVMNFFMI